MLSKLINDALNGVPNIILATFSRNIIFSLSNDYTLPACDTKIQWTHVTPENFEEIIDKLKSNNTSIKYLKFDFDLSIGDLNQVHDALKKNKVVLFISFYYDQTLYKELVQIEIRLVENRNYTYERLQERYKEINKLEKLIKKYSDIDNKEIIKYSDAEIISIRCKRDAFSTAISVVEGLIENARIAYKMGMGILPRNSTPIINYRPDEQKVLIFQETHVQKLEKTEDKSSPLPNH